MIKKSMIGLLILTMMIQLLAPFGQFGLDAVSFGEKNTYYEYDTEGQEGDSYFFGDGTAYNPEAGKGNLFFNGVEQGSVMVQDYNVSSIGWLSGYENAWTRENMFSADKVEGKPYAITSALNEGYGSNPDDAYDTGYVFFKNSSWSNGNIEQGGNAKTARRIWGYFTPSADGYYRFQLETDDGHYVNFYDDDIFYDPKYDIYKSKPYAEQWYRFYDNGIAEMDFIIKGNRRQTIPTRVDTSVTQGSMQVAGHMLSQTKMIHMKKGEVYPFFIEYFNWGGGGKFYFRKSYSRTGHYWSRFRQVDPTLIYPGVANIPRKPGNSGLDLTVEDAVLKIHAYDNFNGDNTGAVVEEGVYDPANDVINEVVWGEIDGMFLKEGKLRSNGGLSSIKLNGDYKHFDRYQISLEIYPKGDQSLGYSNGGLGISHGDDTWVHHTRMELGAYNDKWYKTFDITKKGTITDQNTHGQSLKGKIHFEEKTTPDDDWKNSPVKMEMDIQREGSLGDYKVTTTLSRVEGNMAEISRNVHHVTGEELDLNHFFIQAIEPVNTATTAFDHFDFVATKNLKFDTLSVDWDNHTYELRWQPIFGATRYEVQYQHGIVNGVPQTEAYPIPDDDDNSQVDDIMDGVLKIPDTDPYCNQPFRVIAVFENDNFKKLISNTVYVGGKTSDLKLTGAYEDKDFVAKWNDIRVVGENKVISKTYSLFYEDPDSGEMLPVEGAQNLANQPGSEESFTFTDLQTTSKYYGKRIQVVAKVIYDITSTEHTVLHYSDKLLIKSNVRLGIQHVNDMYVLGWKSEADFAYYNLHRADNKTLFDDKSQIRTVTAYDQIDNSEAVKDSKGNIYKLYPDNDSRYTHKYYIVGGNYNGKYEYSNIEKTNGNETVPDLTWRPTESGQLYEWSSFVGATEVELYYGETADEIKHKIEENTDKGEDFLSDNQFLTTDQLYKNKYVQARYLKNGVWYYTNIVRSTSFDDLGGRMVQHPTKPEQYDFKMSWEDIVWPEDGSGDDGRVSSYTVYYIDDDGQEVVLTSGLKTNTYTIEDIYKDNKHLLNKKMFVKAICPIKDTFGISYDSVLISNTVTPRKIKFDSLSGVLNQDNNDYDLKWDVPVQVNDDDEVPAVVNNYKIHYGVSKEAISTLADTLTPDLLTKKWTNVTKPDPDTPDANENSKYYHKFFKVKARIDGVEYLSNTVYSGEKPELFIDRFNNDFKLKWDQIEHADAIKIYYRADGDSEYKLYSAADLNGNAKTYTLENMIDHPEFDQKYYKIVAVFDGFELSSNEIFVNASIKPIVLKGKFDSGDKGYNVEWNDIEADSYKLYYEDVKTDDDTVDVTTFKEVSVGDDFDSNDTDYKFEKVKSNPYNEKYIRVKGVDGHLSTYSNAVFVHYPTIDGLTGDEDVEVRMSNKVDISYRFSVYEDMKRPYFKIKLTGSDYLKFDKVTAMLKETKNSKTTTLPTRLTSQLNEKTGITTLYVHLKGDSPAFLADDDKVYDLVVSTSVEVNTLKEDEVYEALKNQFSGAENWALPYHVADDKLKVDGNSLSEGMMAEYEVYYNVDDRDVSGNDRQTSKDIFSIDIIMKNKKELPISY